MVDLVERLLEFGNKADHRASSTMLIAADRIAELAAENERLRKVLERLLASPALADENHSDPEWGCEDTAIAVTAARRALEGDE